MADFLNVQEVLHNLHLTEHTTAAEFGCGTGHFSLALAKKIKKGRIYALDIQEEKLSALKGKIAHERILNVFPILCDLEAKFGSTLQADSLDLVLIPNLLFQSADKNAILKEAVRVLKSNGQLLVID